MARKTRTKAASKKIIDEIHEGFTERSERGKRSRATGVQFERAIAVKLRRAFPNARREFGQSREGDEVPDVGETPYWIECGSGRTIKIADKLAQGLAATEHTPHPRYRDLPVAAIVKNTRGVTTVTMTLEDWLDLALRAKQFDRTRL